MHRPLRRLEQLREPRLPARARRRLDGGGEVLPLRALRLVHYATWIARRWEDPTFKRTFGYFGTLQFWEAEIQSLREQIARIDQEE
ncbi:MAG: hypothetical protein HY906_05430 [Deltaproteobacteria bacterium]|nr:hypothetical protein [Deltaproteobacteria bacterium]